MTAGLPAAYGPSEDCSALISDGFSAAARVDGQDGETALKPVASPLVAEVGVQPTVQPDRPVKTAQIERSPMRGQVGEEGLDLGGRGKQAGWTVTRSGRART